VDAAVVAIAERLTATKIATLDRRHFSVVRPRTLLVSSSSVKDACSTEVRDQTWSRYLADFADPAGDIYVIGRLHRPVEGQFLGVASRVHRTGMCRSHVSSDEPRELGERGRTM